MDFTILHTNLTVFDLEKSLEFYEKALGLKPVKVKEKQGVFKLVYLANKQGDHLIELTWLKDRTTPYNLGDCEVHIAFRTNDYEGSHALHEKMGVICYENTEMGLYFINDPDGYWIEILPVRV